VAGGGHQRDPRPEQHVAVEQREPLVREVDEGLGLVPGHLDRVQVPDRLPLAALAEQHRVGEPGGERLVGAAEVGGRPGRADQPARVLGVQVVEGDVVDVVGVDAERPQVTEHRAVGRGQHRVG
jgi:hypothetical protein